MDKILRIGTRDSKLAIWQAREVQKLLEDLGRKTELVMLKSPGDIDLSTPLHQFQETGIFTKMLDDALLSRTIDIAVHSLKDYTTQAAAGIKLAAVLKRGSNTDILVYKDTAGFMEGGSAIIATGSIRRAAQWKNRFPDHDITGLRGNVQTRLQKLNENNWQGAIFAKAGLERIDVLPKNHITLDWMIPAPAQGVIGITCREGEAQLEAILSEINHPETFLTSTVEREFLRTVEGGCSAPVGAYADIKEGKVHFHAGVFDTDGSNKVIYRNSAPIEKAEIFGRNAAMEVLANGGKEIMQKIKNA